MNIVDKAMANLSQVEYALKTIINFNPEYNDFMVPHFKNDAMEMRPYNWNDDEELPNFIHQKSGFSVSWYKHPGRSIKWDPISADNLRQVVIDCLESYKRYELF